MEKCKFAYRKRGEVSLRCQMVKGSVNFCAHQFLCPRTKRWEASSQAEDCKIRKKQQP